MPLPPTMGAVQELATASQKLVRVPPSRFGLAFLARKWLMSVFLMEIPMIFF